MSRFEVQVVAAHAGMLTVTVAFEFPLVGIAARTFA
jgi:hypothetical protein